MLAVLVRGCPRLRRFSGCLTAPLSRFALVDSLRQVDFPFPDGERKAPKEFFARWSRVEGFLGEEKCAVAVLGWLEMGIGARPNGFRVSFWFPFGFTLVSLLVSLWFPFKLETNPDRRL